MDEKTNQIRMHYDRRAAVFGQRYTDGFRNMYYKRMEDDYIDSYLKDDYINKCILDIGTGTGRYAFKFADKAKHIEGIDISEKMIETAERQNHYSNVMLKVMDARSLHYDGDSIDIVLSVGLFEYIEDLRPYFREINRVLKTDGNMIFTCHNRRSFSIHPHGEFKKAYHDIQSLETTLQNCGFRLINYNTTFFVTNIQERIIFSEKIIPNAARKLCLAMTCGINYLAGHTIGLRNRGKEIIAHAKKVRPCS